MPAPSSAVTDTFTNTLTNTGPSAAMLTEHAPASLIGTITNVNCTSAGGGAMCPPASEVTVANLLNGGISMNVPAGGWLTFAIAVTM